MAQRRETLTARDLAVTHGSGNVFADLGLDDAEALQVKAGLTHHISTRIKALGLTQVHAGARLGIGQPDVSKLLHGRYTGYSIDRLIALLNALDVDVEIVVRPRKESASPCRGHVRVLEAVV